MTILDLYNPVFWQLFFASIPSADREYAMLAEVAAKAGVPYSFARARVRDYVAGRLTKLEPTGVLMNPFTPSAFIHRSNGTWH